MVLMSCLTLNFKRSCRVKKSVHMRSCRNRKTTTGFCYGKCLWGWDWAAFRQALKSWHFPEIFWRGCLWEHKHLSQMLCTLFFHNFYCQPLVKCLGEPMWVYSRKMMTYKCKQWLIGAYTVNTGNALALSHRICLIYRWQQYTGTQ